MNYTAVGKLKARAAAARYRHPARDLRIIAIAGPYGKTTTALLLGELLEEAQLSVVTLTSKGCRFKGRSLGAKYDTSAQVLQQQLAKIRQKKANFVILELTEKLLASHVLPTLPIEMAIITGDDLTAQALLKEPSNYAVVPSNFEVDGLGVAPHQAISFGTDELAEAKIATTKLMRGGTEIELVIDHQTKLKLATYLVGEANVRNVAAAVASAYVLAADLGALQEGTARLERVQGNFEKVVTDKPYTIFIDRATATSSVELALESAKALKKRRLLVALDETVDKASYELAKTQTDRLVVVGKGEDEPGVEIAASASEALELVTRAAKKDDLVLFLGRGFTDCDQEGRSMVHHQLEAQV